LAALVVQVIGLELHVRIHLLNLVVQGCEIHVHPINHLTVAAGARHARIPAAADLSIICRLETCFSFLAPLQGILTALGFMV
jgi:hypothetical protein